MVGGASFGSSEDWKERALQNEYLRSHYREMYRLALAARPAPLDRPPPTGQVHRRSRERSRAAELSSQEVARSESLGRVGADLDEEVGIATFVDRRIRILAGEVDEYLTTIERTFEALSQAWAEAPAGGIGPSRRARMTREIDSILRASERLQQRLAEVFVHLSKPEVDLDAPKSGPPCDLDALEKQIRELSSSVKDLMGGVGTVVSASPEDANPLILLRRTRLAAAGLRASVETTPGRD